MSKRGELVSRVKRLRWLIVLGGILAGQFILYGPSLTGQKLLLPLDILGLPSVYLPGEPQIPHDSILCDLVEQFEPARQFALSEFYSGRMPMWNPYQYAGCPVSWPKFSPFLLMECLTASPSILAWTQLVTALVAGTGLYLFLRRALRVSFWPAAICAWCYPVTGFFVFWQGCPMSYPVCWLPWILLAVDRTIRHTGKCAPVSLSILTGLVLVSGGLDVAGQVLLVSGLLAIWRLWNEHRKDLLGKNARRSAAVLVAGWLLGFLLAAPFMLPLLQYAHTGARMERRAGGSEERPPGSMSALPLTVMPDFYGTTTAGHLLYVGGNQPETAAAAYSGLLATLCIAPLAWCNRRFRGQNWFWLLLGLLGLAWCLNVPGLVTLLRLPGLNMMSHNRLVFATSLSVLVLAAIGLEAIWRGKIRWHHWLLLPAATLAGLFAWCLYRSIYLPEPMATKLAAGIAQNNPIDWVKKPSDVLQVQNSFVIIYLTSAVLCGLGLVVWGLVRLQPRWPRWAVPVLGLVLAADLFWFAHGRSAQCDPSLYYPQIPVMEQLRHAPPGRVIGINCLPAALTESLGLHDIRGYDAIDPASLMDLMALAADPKNIHVPYALTQWFLPSATFSTEGIRFPPALDMLGVRYAIFRGTPPSDIKPFLEGQDYWVLINPRALDRTFVPRHVETVADRSKQLEKIGSAQFDSRQVAYVERPLDLPQIIAGQAEIIHETPTDINVAAHMSTPGLVVLADLWDQGWRATLNGQAVSIVRVNHALRGVLAPAGESKLEFIYAPASYRLGLLLAGLATVILLFWFLLTVWGSKKQGWIRSEPEQTS